VNENRHYACRLYNTVAWLHSEVGDPEAALQLNARAARLSAELCNEEAEFNSLVNLAGELIDHRDAGSAWEHLQAAARALGQSTWFQWRFRIRLEAQWAYHWMKRGDLARGRAHAQSAVDLAKPVDARKHHAWGRKLLGDIDVLEDRPAQAVSQYEVGLATLAEHPCPLIEWKICRSLAHAQRLLRRTTEADDSLARTRAVVGRLAEAIADDTLRRGFLGSKAVREL
jgi:hypothetical protein